jgi:hypothetical protein
VGYVRKARKIPKGVAVRGRGGGEGVDFLIIKREK